MGSTENGHGAPPCPRTALALLKPLNRDNDLLDAVGTKIIEVKRPGLSERCVGLPVPELGVDRVADQNFEVVHRAEAGHGERAMPLVQLDGTRPILACGRQRRCRAS